MSLVCGIIFQTDSSKFQNQLLVTLIPDLKDLARPELLNTVRRVSNQTEKILEGQ